MVPLALKRLGRLARLPRFPAAASFSVPLPDGRRIAVQEYGSPAGSPVLYFHGWPASRLEAGLIPDLLPRLLALDRPGYGGSTPLPGRSLLDWPADVAAVADRLGLDRFHIVGLSGGGPYAAACAYALPDRVLGVALVCPVPPSGSVGRRAAGVGHLYRLGRHPVAARRLLGAVRPLLERRLITPRVMVGNVLPQSDRACLTRGTRAALGRVWREGLGRGIQGALSDAEIYARDWGFDLAAIRVPVALWLGGQDSLIPRAASAAYEAIPGIAVHVLPEEGHYSLALRHAGRILGALTGTPDASPQLSSSLSQ